MSSDTTGKSASPSATAAAAGQDSEAAARNELRSETRAEAALPFTGERFTPECVREIRYEHLHRYAFAQALVQGLKVLDAACGEGYGSAILARSAAAVTGVDLSAESVAHARDRYAAPNLDFEAADCLQLPFGDAVFDCVVSFETLEHLEQHDRLLREFRRVLKPQGFLLISSPDKAVYTDRQQNRNPFHVRELYRPELEALLGAHFPAVQLWGQRLAFHSAIWRLQDAGEAADRDTAPAAFLQEGAPDAAYGANDGGPHGGSAAELSRSPRPLHDPVYFIALCAADLAQLPQPAQALSLFDDAGETVYAHYHHEIRKNMSAGELLAARDREIESLRAQLAQRPAAPAEAGARPPGPWWRRWFGGG